MLHKKRKPSTFTSSSGFADCKRNAASNNNMLHSKSTYFYRWLPISCSLAFLLGLGIIFNPVMSDIDKASATTVTANPTDYSSISLTISNNGTELNTGDTISTNVEPGLISYISNNLKIDTKKINRFYVSVQAAEDGSSELTGTNNHATIAPVGNNKIPTATDGNGFGDNTWGFALGEANTANENMSYDSLPAYGTSTAPQYSSANNLADGTYNLKLTFAAKINADKPSDHYTTKAMVSVAADAKSITMLDITKMSELTSDVCKNTSTPSAFLGNGTTVNSNVPTKQLVDERDGNTYWVAKLADGNCWMTQNLAYDGGGEKISLTEDGKLAGWQTDNNVAQYYSPGKYVVYGQVADSSSLFNVGESSGYSPYTEAELKTITDTTKKLIDTSKKKYNEHYLVGNYYSWIAATNGSGYKMATKGENASDSICPVSWRLPTSDGPVNASAANGSFSKLLGIYRMTASDDLTTEPFYYFYPGYSSEYGVSSPKLFGRWWSSTVASANGAYRLGIHFTSGAGEKFTGDASGPENLNNYYNRYWGLSVRCVVLGA